MYETIGLPLGQRILGIPSAPQRKQGSFSLDPLFDPGSLLPQGRTSDKFIYTVMLGHDFVNFLYKEGSV